MGTLAEQLIQRGRAEGIQTGREEGVLNGQREVLARLLALKFGVLPTAAQDRLAAATRDELAEYTQRVLTAENLQAVFKD